MTTHQPDEVERLRPQLEAVIKPIMHHIADRLPDGTDFAVLVMPHGVDALQQRWIVAAYTHRATMRSAAAQWFLQHKRGGKTALQLQWAAHVARRSGASVDALVEHATTNIAREWASFSTSVFDDVSAIAPEQLTDMRRAFYGGCMSMFNLVMEASDDTKSEDEGVYTLDNLFAELIEFRRALDDDT